MSKHDLYVQAINILKSIELVVNDENQYRILRKQVLDLANNIMRIDLHGN
ncbi:MAG: hypothetical protein U0L26_07605 [Cellulosilyticum sp.]|nr:hypothetical protein [Cellulosilyticum sp.]